MLAAGIILAGCAISTPLGPIFGSNEDKTATGSIAAQDNRLNPVMSEADWSQTKTALQAALDPQNPGASIMWANTPTGAHGSVTPVADSFVESKQRCRSFVAALTEAGPTQWYQGKGCLMDGNRWTIASVQPWALPQS